MNLISKIFTFLTLFNFLEDGVSERLHISHCRRTELWLIWLYVAFLSCPPRLLDGISVILDSNLVCYCMVALIAARVIYEHAINIAALFFIVTERQAKLFKMTDFMIMIMVVKQGIIRSHLWCLRLLSRRLGLRAL